MQRKNQWLIARSLHVKRNDNYSVYLETQFFLTPVSPVEGTETGLTGGEKTKYKMEV